MKRINQDASFKKVPSIAVKRSAFQMPFTNQTTFNAGELVPFLVQPVIPGDSFRLKINTLLRFTSTFKRPICGEVKFHYWCFYVPDRIIWDHYAEFYTGYQDQPDWSVENEIKVPHIAFFEDNDGKHTSYVNSMLDHLGIHPDTGGGANIQDAIEVGCSMSQLPLRAICSIWNNWFRCESLQNEIYIYKGDDDIAATTDATADIYSANGSLYGGKLLPLNREWDYFSGGLPAPQKGPAVLLPLGGSAPVKSDNDNLIPVRVKDSISGDVADPFYAGSVLPHGESPVTTYDMNLITGIAGASQGQGYFYHSVSATGSNTGADVIDDHLVFDGDRDRGLDPKQWFFHSDVSDAYADLSQATQININQLRLGFQVQKIREADAMYGTRPNEYIYSHYAVKVPDMRHSIPEFLGSTSFMMNINQVVQTSGDQQLPEVNDAISPQGNVAAYSLTHNKSRWVFSKSFVEWGHIVVVGGARVAHRIVANRGINRNYMTRDRLDVYVPELAHIGFQPVYNKEIYCSLIDENEDFNNEVFNYNQAWEFMRMRPHEVSGYMRPDIDYSIAYWNLADKYDGLPTFSGKWMQEDRTVIDRALTFPSTDSQGNDTGIPQIIYDGYFVLERISPLPISSNPGLVDHSGKIIING